ncbi:hypothetical protein M5G07_06640 [Serratia symbiotica]|nr:hypothetical protein [Serratia symbiotica]
MSMNHTRFYLLEKLQCGDRSQYNFLYALKIPSRFLRSAFSVTLRRILAALLQCVNILALKAQKLVLTKKRQVYLLEEKWHINKTQEPDNAFNALFSRRFALERGEVCVLRLRHLL